MVRPDTAPREFPPDLGLQLFRNLLAHTTDSIYFKDANSRFLRISRRQAERFGLASPEEAIGKTDSDFFAPDHAAAALHDERQIMETGQPIIDKEEWLLWPDGHRTWASTSKLPLRDHDGRIIGTFGISRDITERKRAEEALRKSEESLRIAVEAMERELERARMIQTALLPESFPEKTFLEFAIHYEPLEAVGGDYCSVYPFDPTQVGLFIGDVMGHGVSAALFMALLKFLSDRMAREHGFDPKPFLEELNLMLMDQMPMSFATGLYGLFSRESDRTRLLLAGAGHPSPVLLRAETGQAELLPLSGNAALGLTEEFQTEPRLIELRSGDRIYFYTDGIIEAADPRDEMLGCERLADLLSRNTGALLPETLEKLIAEIHAYRGGAPLEDDILMMGVRVR